MPEINLRDKIKELILSAKKDNIVLELATGTGKSMLALEKAKQLAGADSKILLVVPRLVLIDNWKKEIKKWKHDDLLSKITFITYMSLPKMAGAWDIVIFDECHHLSERCQQSLSAFTIRHCLFLSATIKKETKAFINGYCKYNVQWLSINSRTAINNDVLPEPKLLLLPLDLDDTGFKGNEEFTMLYYPKKSWKNIKRIKQVPYNMRWSWIKSKKPYALKCTQQQYYNELSHYISWLKMHNYKPALKNLWLSKCGERLKWLAYQKLPVVMEILLSTRKARSITFCADIDSSELLGIPCVNSKVGTYSLTMFNRKAISQISCVGMLDEGLNPVDCQVGIFNMLNASSRLQTQRIGK